MLALFLIAFVSSTSALVSKGPAEVRAPAVPLLRGGSYHGSHGSSGLSSGGNSLITTIITAFIAGLFGAGVAGLLGRSLPVEEVEEREREEVQARVLALLQDRELVAKLARLGRKMFH